jgi:putative peptidoglycan lipid II flippase
MRAAAGGWLRRLGSLGDAQSRQIFSAAAIVAVLSLAAKLGGAAREVLIAARFGTDASVDALVLASGLPTYVVDVITGAFPAALVPAYIALRERKDPLAARRLLTGVLVLSVALLTAAALLLAVVGPRYLAFVASGFDPATLALAQRLLGLLLAVVVLGGLAALLTAVLAADEHFALGAAATLAPPLGSVVALLLWADEMGIAAAAVGLIAGAAAQVAVLGWGVARAGATPVRGWRAEATAIRGVIGQYLPVAAGTLLFSSSGLVDQAMAATLGEGSAASLSYGNRVLAVMLGVGATALGTAVLPYFSRMVAAEDWAAIGRTLKTSAALIMAVTVPLTVALVVGSEPLVRLLFERGAFTADDTREVARVQAVLALQIPFFALGILCVRLISSLQANRILMYGAVVAFALNVALDYVLKERFGVPGIALATAIVYAAALAYHAVMLRVLLRRRNAAGG